MCTLTSTVRSLLILLLPLGTEIAKGMLPAVLGMSLSCAPSTPTNHLHCVTCTEANKWEGQWHQESAYSFPKYLTGASPKAQWVKNLPAMQEMRVRSLGQEAPLEEEMANHSCVLAHKWSWIEEPDGLQYGVAKSWTWLSDQAWTNACSRIEDATTQLVFLV